MPTPLILLTGFEPFAKMRRNPSAEAVEWIAQQAGHTHVEAAVLPVEYHLAERRLGDLLDQHHPAAWLGIGLHQGADAIRLERIGVNLDDANLADNGGELRRGLQIVQGGPADYASTLAVEAIANELRERSIPSVLSDSAGRFVCNHVFYWAMHRIQIIGPQRIRIRGGFVHVPWPSDWVPGAPVSHCVTFAAICEAVELCIGVTLRELLRENEKRT